jgi:hypothetical protein
MLTKDTRQHINRLAHAIAHRQFERVRQQLTEHAEQLKQAGLSETECVEMLRADPLGVGIGAGEKSSLEGCKTDP